MGAYLYRFRLSAQVVDGMRSCDSFGSFYSLSMCAALNVGRRASHSSTPSRLDWVWIPDQLLSSAFHRFAVSHHHPLQRRNGSNVPGPLEARRRLARRRVNYLNSRADTGIESSSLPPPPAPSFTLQWLSELWKDDSEPSWTYQPPSPQRRDLLPAWLEHDLHQAQDKINAASPDIGVQATKARGEHAECHDDAIRLLERMAALRLKATELNTDVANSVKAARRHIRHACRRMLLSLVSDHTAMVHIDTSSLDNAVHQILCIWNAVSMPPNARTGSHSKLHAYSILWAGLQAQRRANQPGRPRLYRYLLDRVAALRPCEASCGLLLNMIRHLDGYKQLELHNWVGMITCHILQYSGSSEKCSSTMSEALATALTEVSRPRRLDWVKGTIGSLHIRFVHYVRRLGRPKFDELIQCIKQIADTLQCTTPAVTLGLRLAQRNLEDPGIPVAKLARLTDAEICRKLKGYWSSHLSAPTQEYAMEQKRPPQAPEYSPNPRFRHLAPYFELMWKTRESAHLSNRCVDTVLKILLQQQRAEEFAYVAERVHRSLAFKLTIPQTHIKRWMDTYSATYPKTAIRLSKLLTEPKFNVSDVLIDLMKAPTVTTKALDMFMWREMCKNHLHDWRYVYRRRRRRRHFRLKGHLSPRFAKVMNALAVAYARETRLHSESRFNRIYKLYKYLKLKRARIHPVMGKLFALTGVVLPLLQGHTVRNTRVQFALRVGRVLKAQTPAQGELLRLSRLDAQTRSAHVQTWADEFYGSDWRGWVGLEEAEAENRA